jgi:hypothetical protein
MKPWRQRMFVIVLAGSVLAIGHGVPGQHIGLEVPVGPDRDHSHLIHDGQDAAYRRSDTSEMPPPWGAGLPDMLEARIGAFAPVDPAMDRYEGDYQAGASFVRVDLVFAGVVNPPGPTTDSFDPQFYGLCPVYGFVEFDVDGNVNTGGEMEAPEFRYNATVCRYGGVPVGPEFTGRVSTDGLDSDLVYDTLPWIDRSGEEFHLAIFEEQIDNIIDLSGNQDMLFEPGETWLLEGPFLHRAHGYDIFTLGGAYQPLTELLFAHDLERDLTTISLVYPLTNEAYAQMTAQDLEGEDFDDYNANSVHEALWNLQYSAANPVLPGHEYEPLILEWAAQNPDDYLDPSTWRPTFLLSTVLDEDGVYGGLYTYVDVWPNVVAGDFNADGLASNSDAEAAANFVAQYDGDPLYDADLLVNGVIELVSFAIRFSVFDVNYDGFLDEYDLTYSLQAPGDYDNDCDVDLEDYAAFQRCYAIEQADDSSLLLAGCLDAFDLDADQDVDWTDFGQWAPLNVGPCLDCCPE